MKLDRETFSLELTLIQHFVKRFSCASAPGTKMFFADGFTSAERCSDLGVSPVAW